MANIIDEILKQIPDSEENISDCVFEGANIILYTKKKDFYFDSNGLIKKIVDDIKKRVELRPDPSIVMDQEEAKEIIKNLIPQEAGIANIIFDSQRSIVIIEAEKLGIAIGKHGEILREIKKQTLWMPTISRTPTIRSKIIENIRYVLYENDDFRRKFLNKVGKRVYEGWKRDKKDEWIRISFLGAGRQVGRSCLLLQTQESRILLDCGIDPGSSDESTFPHFDAPEFNINDLDAVIISHPHLDHCLPPHARVLTAEGYKKINDIKVGEDIVSLDWKKGKYIKSKCTEKTFATGHRKILTIKTPYSKIESSPNHRFFVYENLKLKEVEASEIKKGMLLPSNILNKKEMSRELLRLDANVPYDKRRKDDVIVPEYLTPELAEFIGYYMGDGHKSSGFSLRLTDNSIQILGHHRNIIKKLFNFDAVIRHHPDKTKNAFILEINNIKIIRFLEKNIPEMFLMTRNIRAPEIILNSHSDLMKSFLRGFADAEGTVTKGIKITSFSKDMLEDLQFLLSIQGIPSNLNGTDLCLSTKYGIYKFCKSIGFSLQAKQNRLSKIAKNINFSKEDRMPLATMDLKKILKEAGMLGRMHKSPNLSKILPHDLVHLFRGDNSYATRESITKLVEFIARRLETLEYMKSNSSPCLLRSLLTLTRQEVSISTGLKYHNIQHIEENKTADIELVNILTSFMTEKISTIISQTKQNLEDVKQLLSLEVIWERVTNIEEKANPYDYLVDIEVENHNFIAGNIVVHNSGVLCYLYKMGYEGPVYMTAPCRDIVSLLSLDMIGIAQKEGKDPLYSSTDIKNMVKHAICLNYEEVTDITPDIRVTFYNAGHTLGSALVHLHIGNGLHNLVYTGDLLYEDTHLLYRASVNFPRLETVIMESTYGGKNDVGPTRKEAEDYLIEIINKTIERKGKVLMPVLGVGRSQEMMLIIEMAIRENRLPRIPVYIQGMVWDITAIHTTYPDFFNPKIRKSIFHKDHNPFLSDIFKYVGSQKEQQEIIDSGESCVIIATSGMMEGGAIIEYFKQLAENKNHSLVFSSYQANGTLGHRILSGEKEINFGSLERPDIVRVNLEMYAMTGFSGHSNRNQLMNWVRHLDPTPKKVIVVHGESSKTIDLASSIHKQFKVETIAPRNLEVIRLR